MPYTFGSFQVRNVDKAGANLLPASGILTVLPATPVSVVRNTAIGNIVIISFIITGSGGNNFNNRQVRVNFSPFQPNAIPGANLGFESIGFVDGTLREGLFIGNPSPFSFPFTSKNIKARFQRTAATTCYVEIEMYMTMDIAQYVSQNSYLNTDRFLKAQVNGPLLFNDSNSVYGAQRELGIRAQVFNLSTPVTESVQSTARISFESRWYNSFLLGVTTNCRFLNSIAISSPNQIASGAPALTSMIANAPQTPSQNVDDSFIITSAQLSKNEKNFVTMTFFGLARPSVSPNPASTSVRVVLLRIDPVSNTTDFVTDLELKDAVIPAALVPATQLDGAIWSPCSWTNFPLAMNLNFVLDGAFLNLGQKYRLLVNIYDNINNTVTTHLTPELSVTFTPPVTPNIDGYLGTYNKLYSGNDLANVAPHSRFKSRIVIDKSDYNTKLAALGLTGNFDNAFQTATCQVPLISGVTPQIRFYQKNTLTPPANNAVVSDGMVIVSDTATELILDAFFRVVEEQAGTSFQVTWTIQFRMKGYLPGQYLDYQILFNQDITCREFENYEGVPLLVSAKFYDADLYPTNKVEIFDLCGRDYVICEIEKDPTLTGSVNFVACIYPSLDGTGNTALLSIEEEESWTPLTPILPQLSSAKLSNVETDFGGDNFVSFRINLQQIPLGSLFWITGIAYEQDPDYCPLGFVQQVVISTIRPAAVPYWSLGAQAANFVNEILAHPDYVGGINVVYHRVVDINGVSVPFFTLSTTVITNDTLSTVTMPPQPNVYYQLRIDAIFNSGSGNHNVSHTLDVIIPLMNTNDPPVNHSSNAYICNDLG